MPNWLFELINAWTTPFTLVASTVAVCWLCRVRGRALATIALIAAAGVSLWQAWKAGPPNGLLDLQIYTNSARGWIEGGSIYDYRDPTFNLSATYPPIGPLLFSLFTPFTADGREVLFTLVSLSALFGCAWSVSGLALVDEDRRWEWSAWAFAAATVTIPVWLTLRQGQINIILWFLVLVDLESIRTSRRWSGVGIGLATAIKLLPGLFLIWLASTRRWRTTLVAIGSLCVATAIGWILAPGDSRRYWTDLLWDSERVGSVGDARNNSVLSALARLLPDGATRTSLWVVCILVVAAIAIVRSRRASEQGDLLAVAAIIGCASAAISPISWTHHLGFLLVAFVAFVVQSTTRRAKVLCAIGYLLLVDPGGHGDDAFLSTLRALLIVGAVVLTPIRECDESDAVANDQAARTPRRRETNSTLPS